MDKREKRNLTELYSNAHFKEAFDVLALGHELTFEQNSLLLAFAITLVRMYEKDRRLTSYLDLAYFIFLQYGKTTNDLQPLLQFSLNFGLFPIARAIEAQVENTSLMDIIFDANVAAYKHNDYIETLEQKKYRKSITSLVHKEQSYIAPTSYGKSTLVLELLSATTAGSSRVGIIVPTKSLLMQTFRKVKKVVTDRRIIIHDEMYNNEERFVAVLTQERALRLIDEHEVEFDLLIIDEAHNLLGNDNRSVLLSRLIYVVEQKNPDIKILYLSPLVANSDNLSIDSTRRIHESRISFSIKEPKIYEFRLDNRAYLYNRFSNAFHDVGTFANWHEYMLATKTRKNFIYLLSPRKIEKFSEELFDKSKDIGSRQIEDLIAILTKYVHPEFRVVRLLRRGIIYLHGKLPDNIKEYLEHKFVEIDHIDTLVANTVILEGINLPIDSLYIFSTHALDEKDLTNLIGRVNRMDQIFRQEDAFLAKLTPPIHFINTEEYNRKRSNMESKIKTLRSRVFFDIIKNPLLKNYDIEELSYNGERLDNELTRVEKIRSDETSLRVPSTSAVEKLIARLVSIGINTAYKDTHEAAQTILANITDLDADSPEWEGLSVIEKIYRVFIFENASLDDIEIARLAFPEARRYYEMHLNNMHEKSLKENIGSLFDYFKKRQGSKDPFLYVGKSYGEIPRQSDQYPSSTNPVYVNLSTKSDPDLINLCIVKIKMEDDFVNYILHQFVIILHEYQLISDREYNTFVYGTTDERKIRFTKYGISGNLIARLERDGQLNNITFDEFGNLKGNTEFNKYLNTVDDFYRFEITRFI